jgi:aminopeptidase N
MGDDAFQKGIQNYYHRYINGTATTKDFQFEMEQVSGLDLTAFLKQWLHQGGKLVLTGGWKYNAETKMILIDLAQTQKDGFVFNVPVEIGVYRKGKLIPEIKKIEVSTSTTQFSIPFDAEPEQVVIDPRTVLLAESNFVKK